MTLGLCMICLKHTFDFSNHGVPLCHEHNKLSKKEIMERKHKVYQELNPLKDCENKDTEEKPKNTQAVFE